MDENIYFLTQKLKEAMKNDPRFISLSEKEKAMENSEEVISLVMKKESANQKYNDMLKYFPSDSKEAQEAKKELEIAMENLDSHPLVKEYQKAFKEVNIILNKMNSILFQDLKSK